MLHVSKALAHKELVTHVFRWCSAIVNGTLSSPVFVQSSFLQQNTGSRVWKSRLYNEASWHKARLHVSSSDCTFSYHSKVHTKRGSTCYVGEDCHDSSCLVCVPRLAMRLIKYSSVGDDPEVRGNTTAPSDRSRAQKYGTGACIFEDTEHVCWSLSMAPWCRKNRHAP